MARALAGGLRAVGWPAARVRIADPDSRQRELMSQACPGIALFEDNVQALAGADVVVFAVKPQALAACARSLAGAICAARPLVVSIAAGIRVSSLQSWLGGALPVVRCMPNTPALVGCAATGLYASPEVSREGRDLAEAVLRSVGVTVWLERETDLDAVTALSGSGPAYFFYLMEAMEAGAVRLGMSAEAARLLCLQTAFGASKLALESKDNPMQLRARVTSRGGTTERALAALDEGDFRGTVMRAIEAAALRSRVLSDEAEAGGRA